MSGIFRKEKAVLLEKSGIFATKKIIKNEK
jgi:hypothetical protein